MTTNKRHIIHTSFPDYAEYQRTRLSPIARTLITIGSLYLATFAVLDALKYPDNIALLLTLRLLTFIPLLTIYLLIRKGQSNNLFKPLIGLLAVASFVPFLIMNLMIEQKHFLLGFIVMYYLIASHALSPLVGRRVYMMGILGAMAIKVMLIAYFLQGTPLMWSVIPHMIAISLFALIIGVAHIETSIKHYKLAKNAYDAQFKDELTGINSRKGILAQVTNLRDFVNNSQINPTSPDGHPLKHYIMMIDLDFLKAVNDNYGHAMGDAVIRGTAQTIQNSLPDDGHVGRLSGEEFLVLSPLITKQASLKLAEDIRLAISQQAFETPNNKYLNITASIGVTALRADRNLKETLKMADNRLYSGKQQGRNQVIAADQSLPSL
jgi:diguanylate cyclase (GGDEF)-like protein